MQVNSPGTSVLSARPSKGGDSSQIKSRHILVIDRYPATSPPTSIKIRIAPVSRDLPCPHECPYVNPYPSTTTPSTIVIRPILPIRYYKPTQLNGLCHNSYQPSTVA